jgi:hypothetical protein
MSEAARPPRSSAESAARTAARPRTRGAGEHAHRALAAGFAHARAG